MFRVPPSGGTDRENAELQTIHREPAFHLATVTRLHEGRADEEQDDIRPIQRLPDFLIPVLSGQEFEVVPRGDALWLLQRLQCLHHPMLPRLILVRIRQEQPSWMAVRRLIG